jgi:hypothetical protein
MNNFKKVVSLFILTIFLSFSNAFSLVDLKDFGEIKVKTAKIIVPRSVVYADKSLTAVLGYISLGKLISIGAPQSNGKEIVPVIVSGRLAYIEAKDVQILDEENFLSKSSNNFKSEHDYDLILEKPPENLKINNHLLLYLGQNYIGKEAANMFYNIENKNVNWATQLGAIVIHRQSLSKFFYGLGFEYNFVGAGGTNLKSFILSPTFGLNIHKNLLFSIDSFLNLNFTSGTDFKTSQNMRTEPTGFFYGPEIGVRVHLIPKHLFKFWGSMSYKNFKAINMETVYDKNANEILGFSKIQGLSYSVGIDLDL